MLNETMILNVQIVVSKLYLEVDKYMHICHLWYTFISQKEMDVYRMGIIKIMNSSPPYWKYVFKKRQCDI